MGRKLGGGCAPLGDRELGPHVTQCSRAEPTCMSSFILIRPTVCPQCTNVTADRTGQTDRQTTVWYYRANRFTNGRQKTIFKCRSE